MLDPTKNVWEKGLAAVGLGETHTETPDYIPASTDSDDYQYPHFSDELPYRYFDDATGIFYNEHNAGLVYSLSPLTGGNEAVAEQLDAIIRNKISDEFTLQVIIVKHNQVGPKIDRFAAQFSGTGLSDLSKLGSSLEHYYKRAALAGFNTRDATQARLTQSDVFLIVDMPKGKQSEAEIKLALNRFKVKFQAALSAANIGFGACDAIDLLHLVYFYTRHDPNVIYPLDVSYQEETLLKYQTCGHNFSLEVDSVDKDHLRLTDDDENGKPYQTDISVLTLDKMPSEFKLWDNINNTANVFEPEYSITCNHIVSVIYTVDERGKALGKANRKTRDLAKKAKSDYARLVAGTEEQAAQWKGFREDLTKQKTRSVKMLYNVVLFSKAGQREEDVEAAMNSFAFNGLKLSVCRRMQMPYFLVSMPFLFTGNLQADFSLPMMMHHISSWNATQYLPILSDWQGQPGGILMPSMRDQFALIDPFSGYFGTNYNLAVTGVSGAGKSFAVQMLMLTTLFAGGNVYVIDIGGSYRKLCEAVGGVYLEYSNLAMSPFTYVENIYESIDELVELFELLVCPKREASDEDSAAIRVAIIKAFDENGKATLIDHVRDQLEALHDPARYPTAMTLAANIERYTSTAEHGKAFNLPSKLDPNARFIVVDLQEIKTKKHLIAPALLSVFSQFRKRIYDSDRSIKKLCLVDEAWSFFAGDPRAIMYLVEGFRTGRRYNASFGTVTQGINDYFKFEDATQLWENAALKMIFLQDTTTLTTFNKQHELLSAYEMELLKKFPEAKKVGYSQVQIRGAKVNSFHRLFVDPFTLVMLSSDGADYAAVSKLQAEGVPLIDAVEQVAKAHYGDMYDNA